MQIAAFLRLYRASNSTTKDIQTYEAVEKILTLIIAFGEAVGQVVYGYYSGLTVFMQLLIVFQLVFSTAMIMYLDDVLAKGHGLGSGISLFIAVNCAENIFWDVFSPVTMKSEYGMEFEGSFINLVYLLITK
jgi:protein transport protein SEC61 subunit alpha